MVKMLPHAQEAVGPSSGSGATHDESLTPVSSTSKLRSLFRKKKPSASNLQSLPSSSSDSNSTISDMDRLTDDIERRPQLPPKTHSGRSIPLSASRPIPSQSRPQTATKGLLQDPPPHAQAFSLAVLHASLETPTAYSQRASKRQETPSSNSHDSGILLDDHIEVKRLPRRTPSNESICLFRQIQCFLTTDGHILEYDADGGPDRLPEKIFTLTSSSTASTYNSVPGRRWAMQISQAPSNAQLHSKQTLRSTWSRLSLWQNEGKRSVNTLLLVFDDEEDLHTWLTAVQREIEQLGGIEYDSTTQTDDRSWRDNLVRAFGDSLESELDRRPSMPSSVGLPATQTQPGFLCSKALPPVRPTSKQSTSSSAFSSASLDRTGVSTQSSENASTIATSSISGSFFSTSSPVHEKVPVSVGSTTSPRNTLPLRGEISSSHTATKSSSAISPPKSIVERRQLSISNLRNTYCTNITTFSNQTTQNTLPRLATLPGSPEDLASVAKTSGVTGTNDELKLPTTLYSQGAHSRSASKSSSKRPASNSSGTALKGKYSLFPMSHPSETKQESPANPPVILQPVLSSDAKTYPIHLSPSSVEEHGMVQRNHRSFGSKALATAITSHRTSGFLSPRDFDSVPRSPAVTEDMIIMNFGTAPSQALPSPGLPSRVPSLRDLNIDLDFLKYPPDLEQKPYRNSARSSSRSSAISVNSSRLAESPGPPPPGPLPPVPPIDDVRPRSRRSSQHNSARSSRRTSAPRSATLSSQLRATSLKQESAEPMKDEFAFPVSAESSLLPEVRLDERETAYTPSNEVSKGTRPRVSSRSYGKSSKPNLPRIGG